jgi:2-phosphosulfolactate phosphatase
VRVSTVHLNELAGPVPRSAAVVIDVMRAFTVAPWCFARGAAAVRLAPSIAAAVAARARWPSALLLKDGGADPRFDLSNAPGYIRRLDLRGQTIVQVTGNGTRGAHAVGDLDLVLCASFVTAGATARALTEQRVGAVTMLVTEGDEDRALADYLTALLTGAAPDPAGYLQRAGASDAAAELRRRGGDDRFPGNHADDADLCLQLDVFDFALRAEPDENFLSLTPC